MSGGEKFIAGLLLGAAAGVALAIFLQTEKGKELLTNVKDAAGDVKENLKSKMQNIEEEFSGLVKKGKQFVDEVETTAINDAAS